jgi:pyrophosphatase PpaX
MNGIKALLLDVDGTILDTREFILQAAEHALHANGYEPVSRERIAQAVGLSFDDFYYFIVGRRDIDVAPLQSSHRVFQLERLDLSNPFPHSVQTLKTLKERGYKLAAITNRRRSTLLPTLEQDGLDVLFDEIIAADDAPEIKPSPTQLNIALDRFMLVPEEAVMVGDTDIDMAAGRAAGVKTIRVWYGFMGPKNPSVQADVDIEKDILELLDLFP